MVMRRVLLSLPPGGLLQRLELHLGGTAHAIQVHQGAASPQVLRGPRRGPSHGPGAARDGTSEQAGINEEQECSALEKIEHSQERKRESVLCAHEMQTKRKRIQCVPRTSAPRTKEDPTCSEREDQGRKRIQGLHKRTGRKKETPINVPGRKEPAARPTRDAP